MIALVPNALRLLITADSGGSHGTQPRLRKAELAKRTDRRSGGPAAGSQARRETIR
jgi:hypothetical protein